MIFLIFEGLYSKLNRVPPKGYAEVLNSGISERDLIFKNNFMYLFLAVLGLHCCMSFSPVAVRGGGLLSSCGILVCGLFIAVASLVVVPRL